MHSILEVDFESDKICKLETAQQSQCPNIYLQYMSINCKHKKGASHIKGDARAFFSHDHMAVLP